MKTAEETATELFEKFYAIQEFNDWTNDKSMISLLEDLNEEHSDAWEVYWNNLAVSSASQTVTEIIDALLLCKSSLELLSYYEDVQNHLSKLTFKSE